MDTVSFHPHKPKPSSERISSLLSKASFVVLVATLALFPVFFIPSANAPFNFTKTLFVMAGIFLAVSIHALVMLRRGTLTISAPLALYAAWALAAVYVISALMSGDIKDALLGDMFGIYTAGFMVLMTIIMSVIYMVGISETGIKWLYVSLIVSGLLLALYHLLRISFGADLLTFGIFQGPLGSPYGSWNELAILYGLILISGLVMIRQIPLSRTGAALVAIMTVLSLAMLGVVNFYAVWVLVAVASLLSLVQLLADANNQLPGNFFIRTSDKSMTASIIYTAAVFIVAILFVVFNQGIGNAINSKTQISYIEMRPSVSATFDILKQSFPNNAVVGIGPNKFIDIWRLYKDPAINETEFWDVNFAGGSGFVPTGMTTTGTLGILAWLIFLGALLWQGVRFMSHSSRLNSFWQKVGVLSFILSVYLWIVAVIYTPSVATMIVTAVTTGVFFSAYSQLPHIRQRSISFSDHRLRWLSAMGLVIIIVGGLLLLLREVAMHYSAVYEYNRVVNLGAEVERQERWERMAAAYDRSPNDAFARWVTIGLLFTLHGTLSTTDEVDDSRRAMFQSTAQQAVQAGQLAVSADPTEPLNWMTLGQVYSELTLAGVEGAYEKGMEAYDTALKYDPRNPSILLLKAQLESRNDDFEKARLFVKEAIDLKANYTEAYSFSSQLDIIEGEVDDAIDKIKSVVSIEPNNPAWHYQLGMLYISTSDYTPAITSLERAIALDPGFANARYFLSLVLAQSGDFDRALQHMREVEKANPDDPFVREALEAFANNRTVTLPNTPIESEPTDVTDGTVSMDGVEAGQTGSAGNELTPDSALITQ